MKTVMLMSLTLPPLEKGFLPLEQVWASQNWRKKNSGRTSPQGCRQHTQKTNLFHAFRIMKNGTVKTSC